MKAAAIFEAVGRAKAAAGILADVPKQLRIEAATSSIRLTAEQADAVSAAAFRIAHEAIRLCTLLHEIADTQPIGDAHEPHVVARAVDRG